MDVKKEIYEYFNYQDNAGALLLTGQWGCGKTYLVKEIIEELNKKKKFAICMVSLFGLNNISDIRSRVKEEYTHFLLGNTINNLLRLKNKTKNVIDSVMQIAKIATPGNIAVDATSKGVSSLLSFDIFSIFEVKNEVQIREDIKHAKESKEENKKKSKYKIVPFVIVFDDFERCTVQVEDLLGIINEYLENKKIKVLLIADEGKIDNEKYKDFKEKAVSRTIKISDDKNHVAELIIDKYKTDNKRYKAFLLDNKKTIVLAYKHSEYNNLRTLKACLLDFERVYTTCIEFDSDSIDLSWQLYTFCARTYEHKVGKFEKIVPYGFYDIISDNPDENIRKNEIGKIKSKYVENTFNYEFLSISKWICDGEWDKELFISELNKRFFPKDMTYEEKFLSYGFWDLDQEIIDNGLPSIIEKSYKGEISCDELVNLCQKIYLLKQKGIKIPCEIDYAKINLGLDKRFEEIKSGSLSDSCIFDQNISKEIDEEAKLIYKKIESLDKMKISWGCRKQLLEYLEGKPIKRYDLHNRILIEFDDELYEVFSKKFFVANNTGRREMFLVLDGLIFDSRNYSDYSNINVTITNLKKFMNDLKIDIQINKDGISKALSIAFINKITDKEKKLNQVLVELKNSNDVITEN